MVTNDDLMPIRLLDTGDKFRWNGKLYRVCDDTSDDHYLDRHALNCITGERVTIFPDFWVHYIPEEITSTTQEGILI